MTHSDLPESFILIGDYLVNCTSCEIEKDGKVIKLQPKVMDVLEVFLKHPGEVLSREKIESVVWADVVVGYDALTRTIAQLRQAFNDNNDDPWLIKTIPKKGYSLIAPIQKDACLRRNSIIQVKNSVLTARVPAWLKNQFVWLFLLLIAVTLGALNQTLQKQEIDIVISDDIVTRQSSQLIRIAILPFQSLSPAVDYDYFARGVTSELISDISNLPGLLVVSGKGSAVGNINSGNNNALPNADYFISGDVLKVGTQAQINMSLIDSKSGEYLWTKRFSILPSDYPSLREDVIAKVISSLSLQISQQEQAHLMMQYTDNGAAFDLFMQARVLMHNQNMQNNAQAKLLYTKSIDLDPAFGRAYAGYALSYALDYRYQWGAKPHQALATAVEMANVAVSLSPELPETWQALAYISLQNKDTDRAVKSIKRVFKLNKRSADGYAILAGAQINTGHPDKGLEMISRALKLKPEGSYQFLLLLGRAYYFLERYPDAISAFQRSRDINPINLDSLIYLYACYQQTEMPEDAAWMHSQILAVNPDFKLSDWLDAHPINDRKSRQTLSSDLRWLAAM